MDVGLATGCLAEVSLGEVARWAAENGFRALELPVLRRGASWFDGARLVAAKIDDAAAGEIENLLAATGLRIAALSCCQNMLDGDEATRQARWEMLAQAVRAAVRLHVPVVVCHVGRDPSGRVGECLAQWGRLAEPVIRLAQDSGVRLAVENDPCCGAAGAAPADLPGNLAFSPELWEKLFTHASSDAVGLCLDPSHLAWLAVDPLETVTAYAERIYHVQAADCELFRDRLSDCSVLRPHGGWWRYRLPGLGEVPWQRFIDRLQENGYEGAVCVEHHDAAWQGSQERIKRGLVFARGFLDRHIV